MDVDFPYHFDSRGRTASADEADHVQDLIEQLLFTHPGERVNRPDFGSGLLQAVFAPNSDEQAAATRFLIDGALQRWLGERILVEQVQVEAEDTALHVTVQYVVRRTQERRTARISRGV